MAGQMVTLTLMTTAESGVPADWAKAGEVAGGAARAAQSEVARASFRIVFCIGSLHREAGREKTIQHSCHAGYRFSRARAWFDKVAGSGPEGWNEKVSGRDRGRRAGRRGAGRAARDAEHFLRAGGKPDRARAH